VQPQAQVRILLCDDHELVRRGLRSILDGVGGLKVVAEAADADAALKAVEADPPDVVIMDVRLPGRSGIEACRDIRSAFPETRVLMLTAFDGDDDIRRAFEAGAQGYVLKSATAGQLIPALRAVAAGERWVPKEVAQRLSARNSYETLTSRELQVLNEVAKGLANKQIADLLGISEHTVKGHLKIILAKLRVADRTEAMRVAIQRGIIHV